LKLRWRQLTREERKFNDISGTVLVRVDAYNIVPCVLEYQDNLQIGGDIWTEVKVENLCE